MASQSLYRKYRSQTFSQIVGQGHVTRTLLNELETGRIAHAYLLCGPRGTGKTSTARILAKALNCLANGKGEPCNECPMCVAITEGRAFDLIEIDAASNRRIEEIRDLREKVNFAPNEARFKVYIIDEVHMLTNEAFNALLKTLEEPPPHTVFVLATTEPHKIPATIFSRCQRFDFHRIPLADAVARLEHICAEEGIEAEPVALEMIAKSATGSLRDAENLLDQVYAYYGNPITVSQVMAILGITGDARVEELAEALLKKDFAAALTTVNSVASDGFDLRQFNRELVDYLRNLLLLKLGLRNLVDASDDQVVRMQGLTQNVAVETFHQLVKVFSQVDFRYEGNASLLLELAVVESLLGSEGGNVKDEMPLQNSYSALPEQQVAGSGVTKKPLSQISVPRPEERGTGEGAIKTVTPEKIVQSSPTTGENEKKVAGSPARAEADIKVHWSKVIEILQSQPANRNIVAVIRDSCEPELAEEGVLRLNFFYAFHRDKANEPKTRQVIESTLGEVMGKRCRVVCELVVQDKDAELKKSKEDPLVKAALDLGGKISEVL